MFEHGKIAHEYRLSYARGIPYHTLKHMEQSVANVQKLFKKKLDIFDTLYYLNIISYGELQENYKRLKCHSSMNESI